MAEDPRSPGRVTLRRVRRGDEERRADQEFWQALTPEQRVDCLWDMVLEVRTIKGFPGDEPRLQRSVLRIERR
jgi:hypothetical protein